MHSMIFVYPFGLTGLRFECSDSIRSHILVYSHRDNMKQNAWFDTVPPWEAEMACIDAMEREAYRALTQ
jgi:hypothetical protein